MTLKRRRSWESGRFRLLEKGGGAERCKPRRVINIRADESSTATFSDVHPRDRRGCLCRPNDQVLESSQGKATSARLAGRGVVGCTGVGYTTPYPVCGTIRFVAR